jgi:hypothetical protein
MKGGRSGVGWGGVGWGLLPWDVGRCPGIVLMYFLTYIYYFCLFKSSIVRSFYVEYPLRTDPRRSSMLRNTVFLLFLQNSFQIISN